MAAPHARCSRSQKDSHVRRIETGKPATLDMTFAQFPHPDQPNLQRDAARSNSVNFILIGVLGNFIVQCVQLVQEKELKLKLILRMMGTRDTAMWFSWWCVATPERRPRPAARRPCPHPRALLPPHPARRRRCAGSSSS